MISAEFLNTKTSKLSMFGMFIFVVISIVGYQALLLTYFGSKITYKGYLTFILQVGIFYLNLLWAMPKAFELKTIFPFIQRFIFVILTHILLRGLITFGSGTGFAFWKLVFSVEQLLLASMQLVIILGLSFYFGIYLNREKLRKQLIVAVQSELKASAELRHTENMMHQMQLNPHQIFNVLNYIKIKSEETLPEVAEVSQLLADIVRSSLVNIIDIKHIPLTTEINNLKKQFSLYQKLIGSEMWVQFREDYVDKASDIYIPPSLLLTLADNVFKYGVINDPDYPAKIKLSLKNNVLAFTTWNYKRAGIFTSTGLGLKNVQGILDYQYPGSHSLILEDLSDTFELNLKINL